MNAEGPKVIVVGGGLCGLSAAHTVLERGGRVILLDKNAFLGGNSTRATSGINGAATSSQRSLGVSVRSSFALISLARHCAIKCVWSKTC